ncbi:MAG: hypothetical protein IPH07_24135 [Deltaproteobacteria bacterium]|nr:hypothetical protein [Deltaproteobacteria bacterium]
MGVRDESEVRAMAIVEWRRALASSSSAVLVCGAPGAGKTTWVQQHARPGVAYYDGTLTHRATRAQLLRMAEQAGIPARIV